MKGNPILRGVVDYGGLAAFVVGYFLTRDVVKATWWLAIGSIVVLALGFAVERRIAPLPLISGGAALVFSILTLVFHDARFVKMKPTFINFAFAVGLTVGMAMGKNPLKLLLGESLTLPDDVWRKLTVRYAAFFLFVAVLNEAVWRTQPDKTWVLFRFPGLMILTVLFSLLQAPLLMKYLPEGEKPPPPPEVS